MHALPLLSAWGALTAEPCPRQPGAPGSDGGQRWPPTCAPWPLARALPPPHPAKHTMGSGNIGCPWGHGPDEEGLGAAGGGTTAATAGGGASYTAPAADGPGPQPSSGPLVISPALGVGTTLRLTGLDWQSGPNTELSILIYTARALDVPEVCVVLHWQSRAAATYVIGAHDTGVDWIETHSECLLTCDDCGDPCADADYGAARDHNCARCQPCSLCERCSVGLGPVQVCLTCITEEEAMCLAWPKRRRRILLEDLWALRN
jgi:hypothetical protein